MSRYSLKYAPKAWNDLLKSVNRYESQEIGLGTIFLESIDTKIKKISNSPYGYKETIPPFREAPVKKFPFSITYEVKPNNEIIILAIFHTKQHPDTKLPS